MNEEQKSGQQQKWLTVQNWDEQSLSSQSEVTLKKFDSDIVDEIQILDINAILASYPMEDRIHFVIDRNKGIIIDSRDGTIIQNVQLQLLHRQSAPVTTDKNVPLQKNMGSSSLHPYSVPNIPQTTSQHQDKNKSMCQGSQISGDDVWDDYWEQSEKMHQKLLIGICQKNNKILNQLFNKKINHMPLNVNYKSFDNWTPIHFASLHGNIFALEMLLSHPQLYINSLTNFKWSALHVATKNSKTQTIKKLLDADIEPNYQDEDGNTALHYAVQLGYHEAIQILMKKAKNLNTELSNNQGLCPKDLTSNQELLKLLGVQVKNAGVWSRGNRHIQRILQMVNANKNKDDSDKNKKKQAQNSVQAQITDKSMNFGSKKQNIAKMYQLLKQKKPVQKINLDSFKFYKKIGEGAFGQVYIIKKNKQQKTYALKAIKKQKIFGTNLMRYIKTQKQVLSQINHPFIVHLNYAFQTQAYLFLVMDYCEGGDLGKYLEKHRKFDEKTVKKYAAQILLALEELHKQRIIYRDLKPDNIVLDRDGHALLTDFGLSKKTTNIDDINKSFCGTPAYLPLEIINKKGHNRMADWYEYGVVLYELHAGIPPFYAQTRQQLYQNVRTGIVRFPKGSSQAFRDLIKKLLAQNPQKRLGFVNDAQSIKQHRWFDDINWDQVYHKKMQMPKIDNKIVIGDPIKTKFIEQRTDKYLIADWSFIAS